MSFYTFQKLLPSHPRLQLAALGTEVGTSPSSCHVHLHATPHLLGLQTMSSPGDGWGSVHGNFFTKVLRRDWFLNWTNAFRTSAEHSGHQDTDFIQVKCSKPCLLQKSSPPVRDFKIKNRAPSPMTLACIASNKAAPPLHPQLPQLITSQRTLFSHLHTRPPQAQQAAKK